MSNNKIKRRITQYDLARTLGVSQTTVSQVLGNRATATIPVETRQRIIDTARELGYIPDRIGRSLRTGKTFIIAAVIPDITNPFYPTFVRGIQDVAEAHDYHVATYNTDGQAHKEREILQVIQQARVDGLIMAPFHRDIEVLEPLLERNIPVVLMAGHFDNKELGNVPLDTISPDAHTSAEMAVSYLVSRGHRRIGMLCSALADGGITRTEGYRSGLAKHQLPFDEQLLIWCKDFTEQSGEEGLRQLAQRPPLPTALFAGSDQLALGALRAAKELGIAVPQTLAIMGIDDISAARLVSPALTTIAQFQDQQGRLAAQLLIDRLSLGYQGEGRHIDFPYELVVRESA
jgi:LacI family transcriptional regulator